MRICYELSCNQLHPFKRNSGRDFASNLGSLFVLFFFLVCSFSDRLHSNRIWNFLIADLNLMSKFSNVEQRKDGYFANAMLAAI